MAAEGAEPSPKHLESVDEKLTDLKKQICDLRDFLEMKLSHQPEILEILHLDSSDTGAPAPPLKPEKRLMFSASNIKDIESSPNEEDANAHDENLDEYGERKKPIVKARGSLASFVEESMFHFKARAQMQSDRIRATRRSSAPAVNSQSCQSRVKDFVFSPLCSVLITILILVNVVLLGVEVDVAAALPDGEEVPAWFGVTNGVIVVFFVLEMGLKVYGLGYRDFWCGQDCVWNALDFFIVSVSVMDVSLDMLAQMLSSSMNTGHLRLVRAIRLARAVRGVKVVRVFRYITALRTLALSIISTMGSLFWTLALLMLIFYFFAIVLTQLVSDNCRFLKIDGVAGTGHVCQDSLPRFWGSVSESMLTLFMAITNGISWDDTIRPLRQVSYVGIMFVIAYIAIAVLAVLNVVTGVFCNTAIESAHADKEVATIKQVHSKDQQVDALRSIFNEIDIDSSQEVSFQDVQEAMNTGELASFMEAMGISTDDVWTLCMLLDSDKNGRIDLDEFVSGCMQLHGPAKSLQLAKMSFENKLTRRAIQQVKEEIEGLKMSLRSERRPMLTAKETF